MHDLIVLAVLALVVVWAVKESVRHMRGEGGCCGGACNHKEKPEKKPLSGPVVCRYDFHVEGMHCENCAAKVTRAINALDGASAEVKLGRRTAHVECDRDIAPEVIIKAIEDKGYTAAKLRKC